MTTIVFDGYRLVADKKSTSRSSKHECVRCGEITSETAELVDKIIIPEKELLMENNKVLAFAFSGVSAYRESAIELIKHIHKLEDVFNVMLKVFPSAAGPFSVIIIVKDGYYLAKNKNGKMQYKINPNSENVLVFTGSGSPYVEVAHKEYNLKAKECVEFASKYDPSTSFETTEFVLREYPKELSTAKIVTKVEKVIKKKVKETQKKTKSR